jgi:hypothetical protein
MADGRESDPLLLLLAVDALPPVTLDLGLLGWSRRPANIAGGFLEEDAEVWDSQTGGFAQSPQLAGAPR